MADTSSAAVATGASASVCLRASEPSDRPFLLALYGTTREKELALVPWSAEQKEAFLRMQFEAQDRHYRQEFAAARFDIVERRGSPGTPIGRLYVDRRHEAIHVLDITLVPLERGQGIGTSLLTEILDEARSSVRDVSLYVEAENPAMRLYQRLGFRQVRDEGFYRFMVCRPGSAGRVRRRVMKRREFIVGVCGAAVAAGASTSSGDGEALSREHFRDLVKRSFRVYDEGSRFLDELQLIAVEDGPRSRDLQQFDLIFEGVFGEEDLHEGTYVLQETRSRRSYAMHLQDRETTRSYRATFSLLA